MQTKQLDFLNNEQFFYDTSVRLLKEFEPIALNRNPAGYVVGYSGGKDSDVLVDIFIKSGVKFVIIHNHTTIDAPETVYHIRDRFKLWEEKGIKCYVYKPPLNFFQLCYKKLQFPFRMVRFCCSELKECQKAEWTFATHSFGVRRDESVNRKAKRDSIETRDKKNYSDIKKFHFDNSDQVKQTSMCYTHNYFIVNPLAYWSDDILWRYIEAEKIKLNPLYTCGFSRVGCIGCPMAGEHRKAEFERYPKFKQMYLKCADKIMERRIAEGRPNKHNFKTGAEYFDYWLSEPDSSEEILENQIGIFEGDEYLYE